MPTESPPALAVILPAYNEIDGIEQTVRLVRDVLASFERSSEIIVVDDGSSDGTGERAAEVGARVISHPTNRGYGAALKTGILSTRAPAVLIMDADCSYSPEAIARLCSRLAAADMVVGERGLLSRGVPWIRRPAKWCLNRFASFLVGRRIPDLNSGQRVMKREVVLRYLHLMPDGFSFTSTITLAMLANGHTVVYEPIDYVERLGRSKIRAAHFFGFLLLVVRAIVLFNPLKVFLPAGALLFFVGVLELVRDTTASRWSQAAVVAFLAALVVWAIGLLADRISRLELQPVGRPASHPPLLRWLIRAAVTATVLTMLLRVVPLRGVLDALVRIDAWTWAVSLAIFFGGHCANAIKLRLLLGSAELPLSTCLRAQYAGLAANLGMPGLAGGDLVRAAYLARAAGTKRVALATVADRGIDTVVIVLLIAIALPLAGVPPSLRGVVKAAAWWTLGVTMGAAALAAIAWPLRKHAAIASGIGDIWSALRARRGALVSALTISLLVQTAFVLTNVWLARQAGVTTGLAAWFVAWPLSKLIAVLPISLGGLGIREAALVSLLVPYGAPREAVLASGILWQAVLAVNGLSGLVITQTLPAALLSRASIKLPAEEP